MVCWLFKSEPEVFSLTDLQRAPKQTTGWEGVRNYQARNFLRDQAKQGEKVLFYHSSTAEPGVVGVCVIARGAYPDPAQFDKRSEYYDAASTPEAPRWVCVDVTFERALKRTVTLAMLRAEPKLAQMQLLKRGNRLSVMPLTADEFKSIVKLGG